MKRLLLVLGFILASLVCAGQIQNKVNSPYQQQQQSPQYFIPDHNTVPQTNITSNQVPGLNGWAQIGTACAGCPSYYYKVTRTNLMYKAEDGLQYYYFFFYFHSNSYYVDGTPASTYLTEVNFYANQQWVFKVPYILLSPNTVVFGAWLRSQNPNSMVQFAATQMTVY